MRTRSVGGQELAPIHALPGIISWCIVAACVAGVLFYPRAWLYVVIAFAGYVTLRTFIIVFLSSVGDVRSARWRRHDWTEDEDAAGPFGFAPSCVRHVVLVPNYKEQPEVITRTLEGLARQHAASERLIVVLGMEERETGCAEKAAALTERFSDAFLRLVVTTHPAGLPGELACKASNQAWALERVRPVLAELAVDPRRVVVTTCDADSVFDRRYFAAVSHLFARDPRRHRRVWQAPLFYYNNFWDVPAPVRFFTFVYQSEFMASLANPFWKPYPVSTYSLSLRLLDALGSWDRDIISEDWHVFLQAHFATGGDVSLTPVFLPTHCDATDGETWMRAMRNRYLQTLRHGWGAEDVGYMLMRWPGSEAPFVKTLGRFWMVLQAHVVRAVGWAILTSGTIITTWPNRSDFSLLAPMKAPPILQVIYLLATTALTALLLNELVRFPPPSRWQLPWRVGEIVLQWLLLPVTGLVLGALPALEAQTRLLLGVPLAWRVTPKRLAERLSEP